MKRKEIEAWIREHVKEDPGILRVFTAPKDEISLVFEVARVIDMASVGVLVWKLREAFPKITFRTTCISLESRGCPKTIYGKKEKEKL